MPERAIEVVRQAFDEASRVKDPSGRVIDALDPETMEVVFGSFDTDIELHEDPRFPETGVYRGVVAVRRYFAQFTESFDEFTYEADGFEELSEDRVLVLFRLRTRGKDSGVEVEAQPGWIYTVEEGMVSRLDAFLDRADARAAASRTG